ncbi:CCA tRNA nucleotidyltransferase [Virgibacillus kimchii]
MLPQPFKKAKPIIEQIERHNYKAYFVGGCVRDYLLKQDIGDIDIATSASPEVIKQLFPKVIPVGIEHGTVIVRHEHASYEVTTFRIDGNYTDQRHPDSVEFIDQIDEDLKRRDFTINALAMDKRGCIIDLFQGRKDLQNKLIRTVGNAVDRFEEDPLRIIRALRFTSRLGFTIHGDTMQAMKKVKHSIRSLAMERIQNELAKFFSGQSINQGLEYLKTSGVYTELPIIKDNPDLIHQLPKPMLPLQSFGELIALMHFLEDSVSIQEWVKQWKCSNKTKEEALQLHTALLDYINFGIHPWLVYKLKELYFQGFIRLIHCLQINKELSLQELKYTAEQLPIHSKDDLDFNGHDLIGLFPEAKKGPWMQRTLNSVEKAVVTGKLNNHNQEIKEWIKWNPPEIS